MINNTYFTSRQSLKNTDYLPTNICYFFEGDFTEIIDLKNIENNIDTLISVSAFIDVIDYKLTKYNKSNAYSGISLPNNKLIVELNLIRHIKYTTDTKISMSSILTLDNLTKVISIGVPNKIDNIPIEDIIRRGELTITPYIENVFFKKVLNKNILICVSTIINIKF